MAYPDEWPAGATIGRNLARHPKFADPDADTPGWRGVNSTRIKPDENALAGHRLEFRTPRYTSPMALTLTHVTPAEHAGQSITLTLQYAIGAQTDLTLTGAGAADGGYGNSETTIRLPFDPYSQTPFADWEWATFTVDLPSPPFTDDYGTPVEATAYELIFNAGES